ncbi:hypothetical protein PTSG_07056 [Salpingoeca rosetta]|uniref:Myb/SANT-like domain-containing protein n=1 Tax=Salpingoeca rosetta (strain ATCC 50818 / BSB-021) TaxID=946362 RepID=F2UDX3_SALR5|nr:uncharacterized protein PTSG_07056 [Salpingoeca rosetta]EGD74823.1 hypothetical protein PTSG_07056 [Salpingoeca rosetta]|eukprot:XP_004992468.1 hypothetical protein PTSG_07056 [Salpingoeca rosetta]
MNAERTTSSDPAMVGSTVQASFVPVPETQSTSSSASQFTLQSVPDTLVGDMFAGMQHVVQPQQLSGGHYNSPNLLESQLEMTEPRSPHTRERSETQSPSKLDEKPSSYFTWDAAACLKLVNTVANAVSESGCDGVSLTKAEWANVEQIMIGDASGRKAKSKFDALTKEWKAAKDVHDKLYNRSGITPPQTRTYVEAVRLAGHLNADEFQKKARLADKLRRMALMEPLTRLLDGKVPTASRVEPIVRLEVSASRPRTPTRRGRRVGSYKRAQVVDALADDVREMTKRAKDREERIERWKREADAKAEESHKVLVEEVKKGVAEGVRSAMKEGLEALVELLKPTLARERS